MLPRRQGAVTPQAKIMGTNDRFGNQGIARQQGTTRILYDSLPIDGRTEFRFFEGANNRDFPETNTGANGNKLGVGESLAIERAYFATVLFDSVPAVDTLEISPLTLGGAGILNLADGELEIEIANSKVLKPIPITSFYAEFNKNAYHTAYNNFEFDTQIIIPPLLEFVFPYRIPATAAIANTSLRFTVEGVGAIIAPRRTF